MHLLTHVTFTAPEFDPQTEPKPPGDEPAPDPGEPTPRGREMAHLVERGLAAQGWEVLNRWTTPYGHAFDCKRTDRRYDVEVQLVDVEAARWLVSAVARRGLLRRMLGSENSEEHALLLTHLRGVLAGDARLQEPRWFDEAGWNAPHRGPGDALPVA